MTSVQAADPAPKRPIPITIICVISFIGALVAVPMIFSDVASAIGAWYPPLLAVSCVIGLVCTIGLWMMRKWAVYTYTAFAALNQVIMIVMGIWNPLALVIPGIVIVVMFIYISRMR